MKIVVVSDSHGRNDILNAIREKHPDAGLFYSLWRFRG